MRKFAPAACWAMMIILLALLARLGWADRNAVTTLLMVMPLLAFVAIQRSTCGTTTARKG